MKIKNLILVKIFLTFFVTGPLFVCIFMWISKLFEFELMSGLYAAVISGYSRAQPLGIFQWLHRGLVAMITIEIIFLVIAIIYYCKGHFDISTFHPDDFIDIYTFISAIIAVGVYTLFIMSTAKNVS